MSTEAETTGIDPQVLADLDAVMRRVIDGTPVDPEISRRIRERAERVTEETYRAHGDVDVNQLLYDSRDDT
jgi:hypothetical protein